MELLNQKHRAERRTVKHIIDDLANLYEILWRCGMPETQIRHALYEERPRLEAQYRVTAADYSPFTYYSYLIVREPPSTPRDPALTRCMFNYTRLQRNRSDVKYNFLDIVPPVQYDVNKLIGADVAKIRNVLRGLPPGLDFCLPKTTNYKELIKSTAHKIIHGSRLPTHPSPRTFTGDPAGGGRLMFRFSGNRSVCFADNQPLREHVAQHSPPGWFVWHPYDILERYLEPRWVELITVCREMQPGAVNQLQYEYWRMFRNLLAEIFTIFLSRVTGDIIVWVCDDYIWRLSGTFVTLGRYLSDWQITMHFEGAESDLGPQPCCMYNRRHYDYGQITLAQYLYFRLGHKIWQSDGPQYLPTSSLTAMLSQEHQTLVDQYVALWDKYHEDYSRCLYPGATPEEAERIIQKCVDDLVGSWRIHEDREVKQLVASPGTGKSTIIDSLKTSGYDMLVPDTIERNLVIDGMTLYEMLSKTREQILSDFETISVHQKLDQLHALMRHNLYLRSRGCKQHYRRLMRVAIKRALTRIVDENIKVKLIIESAGVDEIFPDSPKRETLGMYIDYYHIDVPTNYAQQAYRSTTEERVADYYQTISYSAEACKFFMRYLENPHYAGRCTAYEILHNSQIIRLENAISEKKLSNMPGMELDFERLCSLLSRPS